MEKLLKPGEFYYLLTNYSDKSTEEIARHLNKDTGQIYNKAHRLGLKKSTEFIRKSVSIRSKGKPNRGAFKKGNIPVNKGKKQTEYMTAEAIEKTKATRFKKGNKPHNTKYDGYISIRKDKSGISYLYIRIAEGKHIPYHRYIWEQEYGPIPKGMNLIFKDGNQANIGLGNLELISNSDLMKRNSLMKYPKIIQDLIQLKGVLTRQINQHANRS